MKPLIDASKQLRQRARFWTRVSVAIFLAALMAAQAAPASAVGNQRSSSSESELRKEIENLKQERTVKEQEAKKKEVAAAEKNDTFQVLAVQLEAANGKVLTKKTTLAGAENKLKVANDDLASAGEAVTQMETEVTDLEDVVAIRAVGVFIDANSSPLPAIGTGAAGDFSARRQAIAESLNGQGFDEADQLKNLKVDLEEQKAKAALAEAEASKQRDLIATELESLEAARSDAAKVAAQAERAYESSLSEAAILKEQGQDIGSQISAKTAALEKQLAAHNKQNSPAPSSPTPGFPSSDQIVKVRVFWIHVDMADNLRKMLDAAEADGITFTGWGFRDHAKQIELRRSHCGSSQWAIWQKRSSTCRPPTARPGRSRHEQGKAIDFQYRGRIIGTHSNPGYKWLNANAAKYGFKNLPSEPWHWSDNGN